MSHLVGVRLRITVAVLSLVLLCTAGTSMWRVRAQNQGIRAPNAVERLTATAPAPRATTSDRGATFRWLEERATSVTTTFTDAVATTERIPGGDLRTRLTDAAGRELGEFDVDRVAAGSDVLTFKKGGQQLVRASGRPGSPPPSLDWSNRQAYALWKDQADDPSKPLEWQADLIRARGSAAIDFHRDMLSMKTEWGEGFAAVASRRAGQRPHPATGAPSRGTTFESQLLRDNLEVGRSRWYPEEQIYVWSVPGLTKGYLDAERMKDVGGWTFVPDLAWTNVQTFAFHYFHTLIATQGFVADTQPAPRQWLARLVDAIAPTVSANEPGCDGFHWLDYTIFRPCCDAHDRCYEKYGCTWRSWWEWWSSWRCTACNIGVTICITSMYPPFSPSYP